MQIGFWWQDPDMPGATAGLGQQDGVIMMAPHHSYISGLAWLRTDPCAISVVTCSYDGAILSLDVEAAQHRVVRHVACR